MNRILNLSLTASSCLAITLSTSLAEEEKAVEPMAKVKPAEAPKISKPVATVTPAVPETPALDLSAIGGNDAPKLKTETSPNFNLSGSKVDLSKMEAKRIDVPELKKIPESDLPTLLQSEKAKAAAKKEESESGMLSGLLKRGKSEEPTIESTKKDESLPVLAIDTIGGKTNSVSSETSEAVEKVKTATTQAASFTAALALAVGEENLPTSTPAGQAIAMEGDSEFQPVTISDGAGAPTLTSEEPKGAAGKIGGFFSGIGHVLDRDKKEVTEEVVATPTIAQPLPLGMNGPPAPVTSEPAMIVATPVPTEEAMIKEKEGFLSGIGGILKRDRRNDGSTIEESEVAEKAAEPKSNGGLFSRKAKPEVTEEMKKEESHSFFGGLIGGKKEKVEDEIKAESTEAEPAKKLRIPSLFKGKKEKAKVAITE